MQIFLVIATLAHLIGTATAMETASHVKTAFEDIDGDATLSRRLRETVNEWYYNSKDFLNQVFSCKTFARSEMPVMMSSPDEQTTFALETDQFRIVSPKLCESSVKQYSGYFNIAKDKHMFFWSVQLQQSTSGHLTKYWSGRFFESRSSPSTDPLILWMNGGPGTINFRYNIYPYRNAGDSSAVGLLFELGPCSIASEGRTTAPNPHSWTNQASMIFLDQPADVGFSYADPGASVKNCADGQRCLRIPPTLL
jgi:cathepsin A (carboxypeptidase C)